MFDSLLPKRCPVCAVRAGGFCGDCRELLPWIIAACEICGAELPEAGICGACQAKPPKYDRAVIPLTYRAPVSAHIQALKYHRQLQHADTLGALICERVWKDSGAPPEALIPIPLHPRRLRHRGFNQALELARRIGGELGVKVSHRALARIKNTIPQTGLGARQRRRNLKDAFRAAAPLGYAHVALVDDVVTSGSTVNAASLALRRAGVEAVSVWAAAKTAL